MLIEEHDIIESGVGFRRVEFSPLSAEKALQHISVSEITSAPTNMRRFLIASIFKTRQNFGSLLFDEF